MKSLLAFVLFLAVSLCATAAEAIPQSGFYVDLYGNLFKDGQNLNRKVSDYARDPANYADGPALDAAVTDVALRGRTHIATTTAAIQAAADAQVATKEAEKQTAITAAQAASDAAIAANAAALAAAQATAATKTTEAATAAAALTAKLAYIDALKAQIVALGATPVAENP